MESPDQAGEQSSSIDAKRVEYYLEEQKAMQNFPLGVLGGLGAALLGAIAWAMITGYSKFQIGYMAVGVGFLVGYAVRFFGKGLEQKFGIAGAALALIGCVAGNYMGMVFIAANELNVGFFSLLTSFPLSTGFELLIENSSPIDLLFYGIALYEGYRFSIRQISPEELQAAGLQGRP